MGQRPREIVHVRVRLATTIDRDLYGHFAAQLAAQGVAVETGRFGADMAVTLVNDGPVTIWMDL